MRAGALGKIPHGNKVVPAFCCRQLYWTELTPQGRPKNKMKGFLAILTWLIVLPLAGEPVTSLPPGLGGAPSQDALPTNGLALPPGTRTLIEKLQFDIEQLHPL